MIFTPDKPLRTAYAAALQLAIGLPVYVDLVPKSDTTPLSYIIISSQTKVRTAVAKPTSTLSDNFGWLSNITLDIQHLSQSGYSNPGVVDDIEEQVINVAENISVAGWAVKSRVQVQSRPLDINTVPNYINRRVLVYQYWLEKLT